jgi:hypothetical protein
MEEYTQSDRKKFGNNINHLNKSILTVKTPQNEETAKISYKHVKRIELNPIPDEKDKYYWFGAYDKLINTNKLKKIFEFYELDKKPIIEKCIVLNDFEIYYECVGNTKYSIPYISHKKDGMAFMKLYYLTIKQINTIFNYINKTEIKIDHEVLDYNNNKYDITSIYDKHDRTLLYGGLLSMGTFLNTNIYTFTHYNKKGESKKTKPKIKSMLKLIKYLSNNFSQYSGEFFMYHLYSKTGVSKTLNGTDLNFLKSNLTKSKNIAITSIQQNSNITIKNINVNNSTSNHYKTASNTRDSIEVTKPQYKSFNSVSEKSFKHEVIKNILIPNKLNFNNTNNNINNVYVVARDKQIRYKTEYDTSEEENEITIINNKNQIFNTPIKKKVINYYS